MTVQQSVGRWGESVAAKHMKTLGFRVVERNWRRQGGELDIIAEANGQWVFVEVKARTNAAFGAPEESVTARKQSLLRRAAWSYLEQHEIMDASWRIDVIAIERSPTGEVARLDHYVNAVEAAVDLGEL
jgi:putative endonuclease